MPYKIPAARKSIGQNQFEVEVSDGKKYTLPSLKYMRPDFMVEVEALPQMAGTKLLLEKYAPGLFAQIETGEDLDAFLEAWQEFSGVNLGESGASAS